MKTCVENGHPVDASQDRCPRCGSIDFVTVAPPSLSPTVRPAPKPGLLITVGDGSAVVPADPPVTLGRGAQSPLRKQFEVYRDVSSFHAAVRRQGARLFVVDRGRFQTWHLGVALDPTSEQDFPLPVTLRFGRKCYVHFAATTMAEPEAAP